MSIVRHREAMKVHIRTGEYRDGFADVEVDLAKLARRLGGKACRNKSRKTRLLQGVVTVEWVDRINAPEPKPIPERHKLVLDILNKDWDEQFRK